MEDDSKEEKSGSEVGSCVKGSGMRNVNKRRQDIDKICLGIKKVRSETINYGIYKQEMEQAWCLGLSEVIANNGVH